MSRTKRNRQQNPCGGFDGEVYWGTADYNRRLLAAYRDQIAALALTRYEWVGLPDTIDPLFIERMLLYRGQVTIAAPRVGRGLGTWVAAKCVTDGPLNLYQRPSKWWAEGQGANTFRFRCDNRNGVVIYDNPTRTDLNNALDLCARELVDIQKTKQMNRLWQKVPFILVVPPDMELSGVNLLGNILGGQPATVANPSIRDIDAYRLDMQVPYIGAELTAAEQNVWNRIYTLLGISNITYKSERMIEDEVRSMSEPAGMMAMSGLMERRRGAKILSERFGFGDVQVVWRADNQSQNYNLLGNLEKTAELLSGSTHGLAEAMRDDS